ncbi:hypothetical protein [Sphingopyxis macrogoltabida]|uniref:Tail tubular protein A n=1 Tax=Sphingopyxis macrogoltabida TaxID=33050 RepID=A0AAC9AXI7_SPHMC|nr:hypothetical protein [Sphingopyxis macrogoltabida]ALJ15360.1 hypothetical protein LH19_20995 [Sphingopyxis macrogoltabida]AMU91609.1 hypothetical protein ATM17_21575 [Sphingopyxis macrogoltabida]
MARNIVQICNEAISDLPAHPIVGIDDSAAEARECNRHLNGVVADLIGMHDWSFCKRRSPLAVVPNDRSGEWGYAYSLPDEIVSPIVLVRDANASSVPGIVVTPMLYWPGPAAGYEQIDYALADNKLYTNLEAAILEYSLDAVEPNKWHPLFAQAVIRTLAARIYRPILGEKADTQEWLVKQQTARAALNQAIADDLNRFPRRRKEFVPEAVIARGAYGYGSVVWP